MRAVIFSEYGDPDVLKYTTDFPHPVLHPTEVLIQVKACALNHLDLWTRRGLSGMKVSLPHVLGCDISGVISAIGSEISHLVPGTRVMLANGVSCGHCISCLSGNDNLCRDYSMIGVSRHGGYAEYVTAPSQNIILIPDDLSFEEAASIPLVLTTVWHMLVTRVQLKPGEDILILAAGSGIGTMAIQLAKILGARVIAAASTDEKLEKAIELGADETINYSQKDFSTEVKKFTDKKGVEVVFEHTGEATWEKSISSLAKNGRLVTCGATSGYVGNTDIRHVFAKHLTIYGSFMGSKAELLEAFKFVQNKKIKAVIDCTLPLEQAADAHFRLMNREQFGKVILIP